MKKFKIGLICAAAVLLMAAIITGCGPQAAKGGGDVIWYYMGDSTSKSNDEIFAKANEYINEELGFSVEFNPVDNASYEQKMKVIMSSGDNYDICWTSNWRNNYAQNVSNGAFMPLDDLLKKTPKLVESMNEGIWEATKVNGKIYGVPCQQIMARSTGAYIPTEYIDKFDELVGTEKLTKFSQITPYIEWLGTQNPGAAQVHLWWQDNAYMYNIDPVLGVKVPGAVRLENDGEIKVFNQFETEEWLDCITTVRKWYESGATLQGKTNQTKATYLPKDIPLAISTWTPNGAADKTRAMKFDFSSRQLSDAYLTTGGVTSTLQAINVNSQNAENAIKLLELVNTDSTLINLLSFGIEGVHYEKLTENTIHKFSKAEHEAKGTSGYGVEAWIFGNVFNGYAVEGNSDDIWVQTKAVNDGAKKSPILGFSADMEPIKTEMNNCNSIVTEYMDKMNEGLVDPIATNNEMLEKLKLAGVDKIIGELQRQIDEWVKNK